MTAIDVPGPVPDDGPVEVFGAPEPPVPTAAAPIAAPPADGPPDAVEYRPDGSIAATVAGTAYRLRPPLLDELFDLWQGADEIAAKYGVDTESRQAAAAKYNDDLAAYQEQLEAHGRDASVEAPIPPEQPFGPTFQRSVMRSNADWTASVFRALATPEFSGRVTAWMSNGQLVGQFINHWQQVPLGPGGPAAGQ